MSAEQGPHTRAALILSTRLENLLSSAAQTDAPMFELNETVLPLSHGNVQGINHDRQRPIEIPKRVNICGNQLE